MLARHAKAVIPQGQLAGYQGTATVGIDAGSTTIKLVVIGEDDDTSTKLFCKPFKKVNGPPKNIIFPLSSRPCARPQVVATQIAVEQYPETVDVVIELGGEDAKILFLTNGVEVRMNGTCGHPKTSSFL